MEVLAGEKAFNDSGDWLPQAMHGFGLAPAGMLSLKNGSLSNRSVSDPIFWIILI